jgi:hypothetical protein
LVSINDINTRIQTPLLWSVVGFTAALNLTIYEDIGLIAAGVTAFVLLIMSNRKSKAIED